MPRSTIEACAQLARRRRILSRGYSYSRRLAETSYRSFGLRLLTNPLQENTAIGACSRDAVIRRVVLRLFFLTVEMGRGPCARRRGVRPARHRNGMCRRRVEDRMETVSEKAGLFCWNSMLAGMGRTKEGEGSLFTPGYGHRGMHESHKKH